MRWSEEFDIVQEEMRRVLAWFEWRVSWWENLASIRQDGNPEILDGSSAYAFKQANIARHMAAWCAAAWLPELNKNGIQPDWAGSYAFLMKKKEQPKQPESEDLLSEVVWEDDNPLDFEEVPSDAEEDDDDDTIDDFEFDD